MHVFVCHRLQGTARTIRNMVHKCLRLRPCLTVLLQLKFITHRYVLGQVTTIQLYPEFHHSDVIMSALASQITSRTIVYSTVYSGADQRKHQSSASLAFVRGIHQWPAQRVCNTENVSIWWRHNVSTICMVICLGHECLLCAGQKILKREPKNALVLTVSALSLRSELMHFYGTHCPMVSVAYLITG